MDSFTIAQLSQFSGVKAHTIRIWEQRYNALRPIRSRGNTRSYDGTQLRRLLNIVSLMDAGYKISEIGSLSDQQLYDLLKNVERNYTPPLTDHFISQLIAAGLEYDEPTFDKIFSHCMLRYGTRDTYTKVIYPLLDRLGFMWATAALHPSHEHFISNLLRQKLHVSIDALPLAGREAETWLLFLPEDEFHEIGLMAANFRLRQEGRRTIYLGASTPLSTLFQAVKETHPHRMLMFLVHNDDPQRIQRYLDDIQAEVKEPDLFVAGDPKVLDKLENREKIFRLHSLKALEDQLFLM